MGAGSPAANSGYMGARGLAAYSGYMGATGCGYMGEGVQLLTVDSWCRGSSCLQWVHDSRGSSCLHVHEAGASCLQRVHGGGVQLLIEGRCGQGIQLLTVGT